MALKYCAVDGCSNLVEHGKYCAEHAASQRYKRRQRKRHDVYHSDNTGFYHSQAWIDLTKLVDIREHNCCQRCGRYVWGRHKHHHHVVPIADDPSLALEPNNIMLLCDKCHPIVEHEQDDAQPKIYPGYFGVNPPGRNEK